MKFEIGEFVVDEDGTVGVVCIMYSDGDIVSYRNDAAHPNPSPLPDVLELMTNNENK